MKTAQVRLGHSDARLTLALYAQAVEAADRQAAETLGRQFFGLTKTNARDGRAIADSRVRGKRQKSRLDQEWALRDSNPRPAGCKVDTSGCSTADSVAGRCGVPGQSSRRVRASSVFVPNCDAVTHFCWDAVLE
jgi:hypothetical protein